MAVRNLVINDPVGIHARPAAMFAQAVTASGQTVTIAKEGGNAVPAGSILSIMGLGIKQGDTVVINVEGDNAEAVAQLLDESDEVKQVLFPGLKSHPGHEIAAKQMDRFGGMVSVRFHSEDAARTFCTSTTLICLAESLGGVESLIEHPATMTHQSAAGSQLEVPRDLVRISIGIEDEADLLADIRQALDAVAAL